VPTGERSPPRHSQGWFNFQCYNGPSNLNSKKRMEHGRQEAGGVCELSKRGCYTRTFRGESVRIPGLYCRGHKTISSAWRLLECKWSPVAFGVDIMRMERVRRPLPSLPQGDNALRSVSMLPPWREHMEASIQYFGHVVIRLHRNMFSGRKRRPAMVEPRGD
jgi:hypothetical protein